MNLPGPTDDLPRCGPYLLKETLGSGGMARVYRALDSRSGREVALKALLAGRGASARQRGRFEREVSALRQLRHPSVVQLLDAGVERGCPWVALELLDGKSVERRLQEEGPLPLYEVYDLAREVGEALAEAHRHAVLHRDVKPDNVLHTARGFVLVDFGLAKDLEVAESLSLSKTGVFLGTPGFWAPEQARGEETSAATDVYGLGALVYAALTDRAPATGESFQEQIIATVDRAPPPPRELRPEVSVGLERWVLRCLAKAPEERFPSLGAALEALEVADAPAPRGPRALLAGALAVPLVLLLAGGAAWGARVPSATPLAEASSPASSPSQTPRGEGSLVAAAPTPDASVSPSAAPAPTATLAPDGTWWPGWRPVSVEGIDPSAVTAWHAFRGELFVSERGVWSLAEDRPPRQVVAEGRFDILEVSHDERYLIGVAGGQVVVWRRGSEEVRQAEPDEPIHTAAASGGSELITVNRGGVLAFWNLSAPGPLKTRLTYRLTQPGRQITGRRLAARCGQQLFLDEGDTIVRLDTQLLRSDSPELQSKSAERLASLQGLSHLEALDGQHYASAAPSGLVLWRAAGRSANPYRGEWEYPEDRLPMALVGSSGALFAAYPDRLQMIRPPAAAPPPGTRQVLRGVPIGLPAQPLQEVACDEWRGQIWILAGGRLFASRALAPR